MFGGRLHTEPELVRSLHIRRPTGTLAALYRMAPLIGWTSLPWLWAIGQPTLVIAGDDDPVTPLVNHPAADGQGANGTRHDRAQLQFGDLREIVGQLPDPRQHAPE